MESFLTIRILDKSVTTPYTVPGMTLKLFTLLVSECEFPFFFLNTVMLQRYTEISNLMLYWFSEMSKILKKKNESKQFANFANGSWIRRFCVLRDNTFKERKVQHMNNSYIKFELSYFCIIIG